MHLKKYYVLIYIISIYSTAYGGVSAKAPLDSIIKPTSSFLRSADTFNLKRFLIVSGATSLSFAGSFIYLNNSWWSDKKNSFHFDGGKSLKHMFILKRDGKYAKNLDKAGHFLGGIITSDLTSSSLSWAGLKSGKELLIGGVFGSVIQGFIEYKDGFAPTWGFSIYDLLSGSLGSFYPYFQTRSRLLKSIDIKFSYYKRNNYYQSITGRNYWNDDYINQTYWLTFNPYRLNKKTNWPKWLGISFGFGVNDHLNNYNIGMPNGESDLGKGAYEFYLSPDLDFTEILPKKYPWQKFAKILNFIKFPAPALRISNQPKLLPIYF